MRGRFSGLKVLITLLCCCVPLIGTATSNDAETAVGAVLDALHRAASEADGGDRFRAIVVLTQIYVRNSGCGVRFGVS